MKVLATEAVYRSVCRLPRFNRNVFFAIALMALVSVVHTSASAHSSLSGEIAGTVLDQRGDSIRGAAIVLFGAAGFEAQRSVTDQSGHFTLDKVVAADYVVSVHKRGFREVRRVLHVVPGETLQLEFQLSVASIFETVTVTPARGQPHFTAGTRRRARRFIGHHPGNFRRA